jgi:acyl-CoA thioester hydrolase
MNDFRWPIRIYYEDTDAGGVVFYANYLKFFERGRTELLRSLGFEQDQLNTEQNVVFVVRSVQVDYLKPAYFNDFLEVNAKVVLAKKASFVFEQEISRNEQILCKGEIKIACIDTISMKPRAVPNSILQALTK